MPDVIMVAQYMSGDRNTIASAMALDPTLHVCVYGDNPRPLAEYFGGQFRGRALAYTVSSDTTSRINSAVKYLSRPGPKNAGHESMYATAHATVTKALKLDPLKTRLLQATSGTELIKQSFRQAPGESRQALKKHWLSFGDPEAFASFLYQLGFDPRRKYAFLWCKTGDATAEKAHHFTDPATWKLLLEGIRERGWIPVLVGDALPGLTPTTPSMVAYWADWKTLMHSKENMGRYEQTALWAYIVAIYGDNCCSIGMRSGILEVPALVGMRTLYLEEAENQQRQRMAKWLTVVDSWYRAVLPRPVGRLQFDYYVGDLVKHGSIQSHPHGMQNYGALARQFAGLFLKDTPNRDIVLLVAIAISPAFVPALRKVDGAFEEIVKIIGSYIRPEDIIFAMSRSSAEQVAGWVADPSAVAVRERDHEKVALAVLNSCVLLIEGGPQPRSGGGGRSAPRRLEGTDEKYHSHHSAMAHPRGGHSGGAGRGSRGGASAATSMVRAPTTAREAAMQEIKALMDIKHGLKPGTPDHNRVFQQIGNLAAKHSISLKGPF